MPIPALPDVSSRFGAPLGRANRLGHPEDVKLYLQRVPINSGGYDSGGAYWGLGAPLYRAVTEDGDSIYIRARDREAAKTIIRSDYYSDARFFR